VRGFRGFALYQIFYHGLDHVIERSAGKRLAGFVLAAGSIRVDGVGDLTKAWHFFDRT